MLNCFTTEMKPDLIPITLLTKENYPVWINTQSPATQTWFTTTQFQPEAGHVRLIPNDQGQISRIVCGVKELNLWSVGNLPLTLPEGHYYLDMPNAQTYLLAWGLGAYQFTRYKKSTRQPAQLYLPPEAAAEIQNQVEAIHFVRDLINTPTEDMGPTELAHVAENLAAQYGAHFTQIIGTDLLTENYASIYTVGRASDDAPRLLDMRWGNATHPKITLVGKGVCFDSGGLDIKPASGMLLMKKDMGGAAHVLGLARMIMQAQLPIQLRVLIPAVENVISGNAYRPGDIIKSRQGLTIEVGNTDAEGRVILADALAEAASEQPTLLIDMATLTGAARVALGTELPAVFSNHDDVVHALIEQSTQQNDPMWRLPLFSLYRDSIISQMADLTNNPTDSYGGAITAALFLKEFVPDDIPWLHFDLMAWNLRARPGRPIGGEAMALRALFHYLQNTYRSFE